ncbi:MAG: radical SAM protein, partial [Victivallaceae bacterium]
MIAINKLYLNTPSPSDSLRYGTDKKRQNHYPEIHERPIVVWNMTRQCNLFCRHCYSRSNSLTAGNEMSEKQAIAMIDDIADFKAPVLLFSGGEPLVRKDLFDLAAYARSKGLRIVLSTNGTMIDEKMAVRLKETGFSYIGVSLDGIGKTHDFFRNSEGAYEKTLQGMRFCRDAGLTVGLRFTVVCGNFAEVPAIFDLLEQEEFPRACFYHLAYSGRGEDISAEDTSLAQKRQLMDLIIDRTVELINQGGK